MFQLINKSAPKFTLLLILFISACSHSYSSYKPLAHITEASMKEATTESYATLKDSVKELKGVFLPSKASPKDGQ